MREKKYCDRCHLSFGLAEKPVVINGMELHEACKSAFNADLASGKITIGPGRVRA